MCLLDTLPFLVVPKVHTLDSALLQSVLSSSTLTAMPWTRIVGTLLGTKEPCSKMDRCSVGKIHDVRCTPHGPHLRGGCKHDWQA